jgi:hypothetical protein
MADERCFHILSAFLMQHSHTADGKQITTENAMTFTCTEMHGTKTTVALSFSVDVSFLIGYGTIGFASLQRLRTFSYHSN